MLHTPETVRNPESPKEMERKFLVGKIPENLDQFRKSEIAQGYLASSGESEVRIRRTDDEFVLTVKSAGGAVRDEKEIKITQEQFDELWQMTNEKRIEKTRYYIPLDEDATAEFDMYKGEHEGLTTVEVEFSDLEGLKTFSPPEWFGEEVTDIAEYRNSNLAENGVPHQSEAESTYKVKTPEESKLGVPEYNLEEGVEALSRMISEFKDSRAESVVVLVAGGSASGKTSAVAAKLRDQYGPEALLLSMDDYYRGRKFMQSQKEQGNELNWDQPEALNLDRLFADLDTLKYGGSIEKPVYSLAQEEEMGTERVESRKVIIVEGLFALNDSVAPVGDIKAFVKTGVHGRLLRRILRDVDGRRKQEPKNILKYFAKTVEPMNRIYIDSTVKNADVIVNNEYQPEKEAKGMHEMQLKFPGTIDERTLRTVGADRLGEVNQVDEYFAIPGGDGSTDEVLRIRDEGGRLYFTYKGPQVASDDFRERPKYEFEIYPEIKAEIEKLYPKKDRVITKKRSLFQSDGVLFSIDSQVRLEEADGRTEELGDFVEIRAVSSAVKLNAFMEKSGLGARSSDKRSYGEM